MHHFPQPSLALLASLVLLCQGFVAAADWPQWRGPDRNGLAEGSPELLNSLAGQLPTWRSELIASGDQGGRGSLAIDSGGVYGLTAVTTGGKRYDTAFCLDANTGRSVWMSRLAASGNQTTGSSTPCVFDGRLYVVGSEHTAYCLDAATGEPLWETKIARTPGTSLSSSIAIVDGVAVLLADALTGLDFETGAVRWTQYEVAGHESSATQWETGGREFIICNSRRKTHCIDPRTGDVIWSVPGGGKSTPAVVYEYGGDFLVNMSDSRRNGLTAHRLTREGPQKLWSVAAYDRGSSPVVHDGHVYGVAGGSNGHGARLVCVHLDSGAIAWDEVIDFAEVSSPIIADGKVFAVCGTTLFLLQATPEKYRVLSQVDWRTALCTSPAIVNGRLYLRQSDTVACYDVRSGE